MAGISGRAFRLQARRFGAGLVTTEMVSAAMACTITTGGHRTMLELMAPEHPVAVQLFGNQPEVMAEAAKAAEAAGADIIDINMGCPVRKVVKTGAGVALMADEKLAARVTAAVVEAVSVPVTVKIRSGLKRAGDSAFFCAAATGCGSCGDLHPSEFGGSGTEGASRPRGIRGAGGVAGSAGDRQRRHRGAATGSGSIGKGMRRYHDRPRFAWEIPGFLRTFWAAPLRGAAQSRKSSPSSNSSIEMSPGRWAKSAPRDTCESSTAGI